ncbi:IclR family transcriptional regulator [Clostridium sp. MT-14]|jgi:DNA-binding IclR family transcriptional regulator|uniref:IclR family transcriptional regulator n=1 Tax=Clostridium aromativorans TaxID=2836848 RepID=A0ABS8N623_9CLOT|nr:MULTISPECIES: IclR family transcriptional regulator [Clostridium]KAA8680540.1 IclR family transcriptional regulator [Clostridium sp. HV4-5-A1G]MCC9295266.1 IclR family transcriptional regulator [Clostridium aromativorans]CAB1261862.1 putative HTH-type transcriptional regulator XynR [Clostridiaceae bacterium BL-3]
MENLESKLLIQSIIRGVDVFQCFKDDNTEMGIKEISGIVNLSESTVYRILSTLEYRGILIQNKKNKKYRLGLSLLKTVNRMNNFKSWSMEANNCMMELQREFNETVNLAVRDEDNAIYINSIGSSHVLRPNLEIGSKYPCHCSGLGKCLLMDFPENKLKMLLKFPLKKFTDKTIVNMDALMKNLKKGRENGYILDYEEFQIGLVCISAPIRAFGNKIVAAISVSIPTVRVNDKICTKIKDKVVKTAREISMKLEN